MWPLHQQHNRSVGRWLAARLHFAMAFVVAGDCGLAARGVRCAAVSPGKFLFLASVLRSSCRREAEQRFPGIAIGDRISAPGWLEAALTRQPAGVRASAPNNGEEAHPRLGVHLQC